MEQFTIFLTEPRTTGEEWIDFNMEWARLCTAFPVYAERVDFDDPYTELGGEG